MKRLLALSLLLVISPNILYSQVTRDTTIYTATRIRTASNGNIISISVVKTGIPTSSTPSRVDTVIVTKRDTVLQPGPRQYYYWQPILFADNVVRYTTASASLTQPADIKLNVPSARVDTVIIKSKPDTVTITLHDTVTIKIPAPPCICNQPPPPSNIAGLHISDLPSRVGEMNVYNDSTYLGRLMYQDNRPGKIWFAFQFKLGELSMTQLPLAYSDSLSAMSYLLHPDNPPPNPINLNPNVPQLPGALLKPN